MSRRAQCRYGGKCARSSKQCINMNLYIYICVSSHREKEPVILHTYGLLNEERGEEASGGEERGEGGTRGERRRGL